MDLQLDYIQKKGSQVYFWFTFRILRCGNEIISREYTPKKNKKKITNGISIHRNQHFHSKTPEKLSNRWFYQSDISFYFWHLRITLYQKQN